MRPLQSCLLLLSVFSCRSVIAQTTTPLPIQQQAAVAFSSSGNFPSSIGLSGNANWVAGSQTDTGSLSLWVSSDGSTSENWSFSTVPHSFTQGPLDLSGFSRNCIYTDTKGKQHAVTGPNCLQGLPWFFPSFVLQPAYAAALTVSDQTGDADSAQGLEKLTYSLTLPALPSAPASASNTLLLIQKATNFTIYYDTKTALPSRLVYQQTLDGDDSRGLEVAIEYGNYSPESGFMVPHRIQRYVQRTLTADVTVSSVTIQ